MSVNSFNRHYMLSIGVLIMVGIAMLGIGALASESVKEMQLKRDGEETAMRWARMFDDERSNTFTMFRTRRTSEHVFTNIWNSLEVGRIVSYEIYDRNGKVFYTTGASDWQPSESADALLNSPITKRHINTGLPTTRLHTLNSPSGVSNYASVVIPFRLADSYQGSIVAFVDQTKHVLSLTHSFKIIATATAILLLALLGTAVILVMRKGRERSEAEARARYLSDHDDLTGLPNRQSFVKLLDAALEERRKSKGKVAVVHLDISRFKEINDALGQSAGDRVLRAVAERIKANLSGNDFAARLGSNEFAVALTSTKCTEEVVTFVNKLREALNASYWVNSEDISCTFYMGAAVAPSDGDDPASLARHANLALNRAKSQRAGRFEFFERSMDIAFQRRRERETDLRNAVSNGEFELVFQPQICVARNAISGQEALLRWHHPVHGTISPAYFIPLAEETGLIIPIGEWVLRQACEQAVSWEMPLNVAVNLSPVQFENGRIAETVARVLEETGLDPARLELEITETTLMGDTQMIVSELTKLRNLGVAIAMDDFGTGYSSLSYLSSFPFNKIKIDKTFIQSITHDEALNAIVKCIIAMGRSLDVTITAEGVETQEQADLLFEYGCHQVRGYLYGYPASPEECARLVKEAAETTAFEPAPKREMAGASAISAA